MKAKYVIAACVGIAAILAVGLFASQAVRGIKAEIRPDIKVSVDGKDLAVKDSDGKELSVILYQGRTYLPVRALGEALGNQVEWNKDKKVVQVTRGNTPSTIPPGTTDVDAASELAAADKRIKELDQWTDILIEEIGKLTPSTEPLDSYKVFVQYDKRMDALITEIAQYRDKLEEQYQNGVFTFVSYREREMALKLVEAKFTKLDETIALNLGIEL